MADIEIKELGLFATIRENEDGIPVGGTEIKGNVIPSNLEEVIIYMLFAGKPGSYWLTINVKSDGFKSDRRADITVPSQYVSIPVGGNTHFTIPVALDKLLPGRYVFSVSLASVRLAELTFVIDN